MPGSAPAPHLAFPAGAIALGCVLVTAIVLLGGASVQVVRAVLVLLTAGVVLMAVAALRSARAEHARAQCPPMERPQSAPGWQPGQPGPFQQVDQRQAAQPGGRAEQQRVEIFVNLARRMQSLVHREIELLDDLEAKVDDPELLKGLFAVDHLATRLRRQSESLAVLGGSASRRQWTRQVTVHEALRAAIGEVEQYQRVKVVPPVDGALHSAAVTDVIHLVAELVENATKYSAPHTTALLRAKHVPAGIAVEIEDRGLGMLPVDNQRMNALLAEPRSVDVDELLRDGRIGLYVVAVLARRHGIRVELRHNIYGGTLAVVTLPVSVVDSTVRALPQGEVADEDGVFGPRFSRGSMPDRSFAPAAERVMPPPLPTRRRDTGASPQIDPWSLAQPSVGGLASDHVGR